MLLATILLILNIIALIVNGVPFIPWIWNLFAYIIEIGFYLIILLIVVVIGGIVSR